MTRILDRIMETTTTTGTGTLTLGGAVAGYRSFSVVGNGNTCYFCTNDGTNWEIAAGVYTTSGTTLSRGTILASSNANAAVSWSAGTKQVFVCAPAFRLKDVLDQSSNTTWDDSADTISFYDSSADDIKRITRSNLLYNQGVVDVVATSNGTITTAFANGQGVDGVTLTTGMTILIAGQSTGSQNIIGIVQASGAPTNSPLYPTGANVAGVTFQVRGGTANGGSSWVCTNASGSDIVGSNNLTFALAVVQAPSSPNQGAIPMYSGTKWDKLNPSATTGAPLISGGGTANLVFEANSVIFDESNSGKLKYNAAVSVYNAVTPASNTYTCNLNTANLHTCALAATNTIALSNATVGQVFAIRLLQDGTGSRTVTWFTTIKWAGGTAPTLTTTLNKADWFGFICTGTNTYDGFVIGQNI